MFEKSSLKRFNSSNGIRLHDQSAQGEEGEEEDKYQSYSKTPFEVGDHKITGDFMNLAHHVTVAHNKEIVIKGKDDPDIENDCTKAVNNISSGKYLNFRPYLGSMDDRPMLLK